MRLLPFILFGFIVSCGEVQEKETDNAVPEDLPFEEEEMTAPEVPERSVYIDENLIAGGELVYSDPDENNQKFVYIEIDREKYLVQKYEGQLLKASGHAEGFVLHFEPYDYWDEEEGYFVESKEVGDRDIVLSKAQNDYLGFVDYTKETNNLAWDFYENLFIIYFYDDDEWLYPLKFINEGKTEWDG